MVHNFHCHDLEGHSSSFRAHLKVERFFFPPRKIFLFKINFIKLYTTREVWNVLQSQFAQFLVSVHSSHLNNDERNLHSIAASELGTAMQIESNS
jgi:hypothetical protein